MQMIDGDCRAIHVKVGEEIIDQFHRELPSKVRHFYWKKKVTEWIGGAMRVHTGNVKCVYHFVAKRVTA